MISSRETVSRRGIAAGIAALALTLFASVAFIANASVQDRRISLADAEALAEVARQDSDFPIVVNDLVLQQLNRFLGTPDGRDYIRRSLAQMQNHKDTVQAALVRYNLPIELMAVPIIESGYRNLTPHHNPVQAAGIWQFIPQTARNFGLRVVDEEVDERLNVELETDAAMRFFASLHLQFQDWGLALLGYNGGPGLVSRGIQETGSREVWDLIRNGHEGNKDYVAKVIAAAIIIKNPSTVN